MTRTSASFLPRLKREEGFSASPYWDRTHWTWGYGTRAPGQYGTITEEQAEDELLTHVSMAEGHYLIVFQTDPPGLTQARYDSIIDMLYNLGLAGFTAFVYTIAAIREGNWVRAAAHAQQSLWYRQVGKRARQVVEEFRTGVGECDIPVVKDTAIPATPPAPVVEGTTWTDRLLGFFNSIVQLLRRRS